MSVRVGKDHRADVAAFHDHSAVAPQRALHHVERLADAGQPRDSRSGRIDLRRPDRGGDVFPIHAHGSVADLLELNPPGQGGQRLLVCQIDSAP